MKEVKVPISFDFSFGSVNSMLDLVRQIAWFLQCERCVEKVSKTVKPKDPKQDRKSAAHDICTSAGLRGKSKRT